MKVVIFDFDGTIADTLEPLLAISNRLAEEFNYPSLDLETVKRLKSLSSRDIIRQSNISLFKIPFLLRRLKSELSQEIGQVQPFPGISEALKTLRQNGNRLGIVTSNSTDNVHTFLRVHELGYLFDFVYSGTTIFGKHRVLNRILKQKGLDTQSVVYVGDETRDIESALKVPVQVIAVTWGFNTREILAQHGPDYLVDDPKELVRLIG